MNTKRILVLTVLFFLVLCGGLVAKSGLFADSPAGRGCILLQNSAAAETQDKPAQPLEQPAQIQQAQTPVVYTADQSPAAIETLGSIDPDSGYEFRLELTTKGAAIRTATFSDFDDRDYNDPQPLNILSPVEFAGKEILSMANRSLVFADQGQQLPLDMLHWRSLGVTSEQDGSQTAGFEAVIKEQNTDEALLKLTKSYHVVKESFSIGYDLKIENLSNTEQKVRFDLAGPVGPGREGVRGDMRKVVGGFRNAAGEITSMRLDKRKLVSIKGGWLGGRVSSSEKPLEDRKLVKNSDAFLWAAVTNKYFAAIVVPEPDEGNEFCDWVAQKSGRFYNPDGDEKYDSGDETIGLDMQIAARTLSATGQADSSREYNFEIYIGPKDKRLFDKSERYRGLGFMHTIDFLGCCCPAALIHPLAFGILAAMEWMYRFIPNYGVVIIILVFLIRLAIHPLTKKSQVSMSKFSKIAPKIEELKKKYGDNKAELQKRTMALYKEQGASPIVGMLPMMVQMPIWIALYSAIYASIALRGAAFLPFWITDLSAPDALFRFKEITLPIFGKLNSFNLLPILMGVAFYMQQKLMPKQATAAANPQVAQQQKMMMIMMPIMFPLMLYKAPSGLNLYIMASTFAGVLEQYVIRKHIREKEQAESKGLVPVTSKTGGKVKKKKPKPFYKNY